MKSAGKARSNGLYRHIRTSKEIIRNLLNYYYNYFICAILHYLLKFHFIKRIPKAGACKIKCVS